MATTRVIWILLVTCGVWLTSALPAEALTWYWGAHPDKERLVFAFDGPVGDYTLRRTGKKQLTLTLPANEGKLARKKGSKSPAGMKLLSSPSTRGRTVTIPLKTPAFGYIHTKVSGNRLVVDVFSDSIGARWKPPVAEKPKTTPKPKTKPKATPKPPKAKSKRPASKKKAIIEAPGTRDLSSSVPAPVKEETLNDDPVAQIRNKLSDVLLGKKDESLAKPPVNTTPTPAPAPVVKKQAPIPMTAPEPAPVVQGHNERPFFAVPYTYRAKINTGGPEDWKEGRQVAAPRAIIPAPAATSPNVPQTPEAWKKDAKGDINPQALALAQQAEEQQRRERAAAQKQNKPTPKAKPSQGREKQTFVARGKVAASDEIVTTENDKNKEAPQNEKQQAEAAEATPSQTGANRFEVSEATRQAQPTPQPAAPQAEPKVELKPLDAPKPELQEVASNKPEPVEQEEEVIYVDADGNPIPEPPKPEDLIFQAQAALNNGDVASALAQFKEIKKLNMITPEQREEILYNIADATYSLGKDDLTANYSDIIHTTTEAMNFNLKSPKVPQALLRIGYVNLKIGNAREAQAYFNILKRKYPNADQIPMTYYYWGEHSFKNKDWQKAADNFQYIVQNYPDSKFVREAAVNLARSLYKLEYYDQAFQIVDFIEKRFPRFYVEYPPFLNIMGDVAYRLKEYEKARIHYWTYYNIDPDGDDADTVLARLGDIYLLMGKKQSAKEIYEEAARKFPERDGGLISLMRLAEEGINDTPSISEMFTVFDRPLNLRPLQIYSRIIEDHPTSPLAPLARLKKAMWYLWNKEYGEVLATATAFSKKYPGHELSDKVKEVALRAFNIMVADNIREENYDNILKLWDQYPIVRGQETKLAPESRVALGLSYWKKGQPSKALEVVDPFFQGLKVPEYSEMALGLALSVYLDNEKWEDITDLARRVDLWELNPATERQLDYAKALAYENLDDAESALPLWEKLRKDKDVPDLQEAYTFYFLSRDALRKEEYQKAHQYATTSLRGFRDAAKKDPDQADTEKEKDLLASLIDITENTGRTKEALKWAREYAQQIDKNDPDYLGLRYRLGRLYKKTGDIEKWRSILTDLKKSNPTSLYGKMAESELRTYKLQQNASQFSPTGKL